MTELVRSEPVIQAAKVTKYFGEDCVLKEADLILRKGEVCGIVGNNGSGKTVLMKCICGFFARDLRSDPGTGKGDRKGYRLSGKSGCDY